MDIPSINRQAWDKQVEKGNRWTVPVTSEEVEKARAGHWEIVLTPTRPVPEEWFPKLSGAKVLCLAGGGGQQGPILAAAGAWVTVLDNSPAQLAKDRAVAERDGLGLDTVLGDMADLSRFSDASFDLVVLPAAVMFVADVAPVWREVHRVLRRGGVLLAGFTNPIEYIFDEESLERGELVVANAIPYADTETLPEEEIEKRVEGGTPLEFGHSLEDLIGGQLEAGFTVTGFYEDRSPEGDDDPLRPHIATYFATRAKKV